MKDYTDEYILFILSYNRPNNIVTLDTLRKLGYSHPYYLVISDDDPSLEEYLEKYGDKCLVFNKEHEKKSMNMDMGDNFDKYTVSIIPRNYCFKIAKEMGYKFFCELDDDYRYFAYRYVEGDKLKTIEDLPLFDNIMNAMFNFLVNTNADAVAFAQGGDYIGGIESNIIENRILRKLMNGYFFRTDRPVNFKGTMNEDVNTYVTDGMRGKLYLTPCEISLGQVQTQKNSGGLTDLYKNNTYTKSFYAVMYSPSNVKISAMGVNEYRIHHKISNNRTYPKILHEKYKKI